MNKIILLSLITLVSSCDFLWNFFEPEFNIIEKDYVAGIVDGDPEPPYATPNMSKSSLLGIDKDNDGVRDDIEIWINRNVDEAKIRQYLKVYIKRQNGFLTCSGESDCLNAYRVYRRSSACLGIIIIGETWRLDSIHKLQRVVRTLFFNSDNRKKHDSKMSDYLAATSWGSEDFLGSYLLKNDFCQFEISIDDKYLNNIWSYSNRAYFVRNVKEGLYEKYFNLHVDINDYPNICDGFHGTEQNLCD